MQVSVTPELKSVARPQRPELVDPRLGAIATLVIPDLTPVAGAPGPELETAAESKKKKEMSGVKRDGQAC